MIFLFIVRPLTLCARMSGLSGPLNKSSPGRQSTMDEIRKLDKDMWSEARGASIMPQQNAEWKALFRTTQIPVSNRLSYTQCVYIGGNMLVEHICIGIKYVSESR